MHYIRNRLLTRVSNPAAEPLTLAETKLYLRVDSNDDDTLISDLITASRMTAEDWLKRSLITQSWQLVFDNGLASANPLMALRPPSTLLSGHGQHWLYNMVRLPMTPVTNVSSVITINRDNTTATLDPSSYYLSADHSELILTTLTFTFRTEINYTAGYGDAVYVPKPIKQGMLAHIADMYDSRGQDGNVALPEQAIKLYLPFREVRL